MACSFADLFIQTLPRAWAIGFGEWLSRRLPGILPKRQALILENLSRSFPEKSSADCARIAAAVWHNLGRTAVEVITGSLGAGLYWRFELLRRTLGGEKEEVGDKQPLLQQVLAAGNVSRESARLFPPGDIAVEVRAGEILIAGLAILGTTRRRGVQEEAVDAFAKRRAQSWRP